VPGPACLRPRPSIHYVPALVEQPQSSRIVTKLSTASPSLIQTRQLSIPNSITQARSSNASLVVESHSITSCSFIALHRQDSSCEVATRLNSLSQSRNSFTNQSHFLFHHPLKNHTLRHHFTKQFPIRNRGPGSRKSKIRLILKGPWTNSRQYEPLTQAHPVPSWQQMHSFSLHLWP
jgi:hypothetical protein